MSLKAMTWVFEHSPYESRDLLIHLVIADTVNPDYDWQCWLSKSKIAERARCSERTVQRTLARMVADGWLELVEETPGKPSTYRFVTRGLGVGHGDRGQAEGGDKTDQRGRTNPAPSPITNPKGNPTSEKGRKRHPYSPSEQAAWDALPLGTRQKSNKRDSIACYREQIRNGGTHAQLLAATQGYARFCEASAARERGWGFYKLATTLWGPSDNWRDYLPIDSPERHDLDFADHAYKVWDRTGTWVNESGETLLTSPADSGILRPMDAAGNMIDAEGRRYTVGGGGTRVYR